MIFIGGIQPKTVNVDNTPRICPSCGLAQAHLKRVDHYASLFFIPLLRVRQGEEFLYCNRCDQPVSCSTGPKRGTGTRDSTCRACGRELEPSFTFCPYCGRPKDE
jgi:hypothetical protein